MWRLGGGCALPLGGYAELDEDRNLRLVALVATPEGDRVLRVETSGADPETVAGEAARALIEEGAEEILAEVSEP